VIRKIGKKLGTQIGVDDLLRRAYVETARLGERACFGLRGGPAPSSALILSASGRSGTTWLADVLCRAARAQTIFEPLHEGQFPEVRRLAGWEGESRVRAAYLRATDASPGWREYLERVLTGRVRSYWTDYTRTTFFPERFLIKAIRANMMLGFIRRNFSPKIIHMVRHPCAVVASRLEGGWDAQVSDILSQRALVEDVLSPLVADIAREHDAVGAHAVWWAVENAVARRDLEGHPHVFVFYETLMGDKTRGIQSILADLELEQTTPSPTFVERPSRTTTPMHRGDDAERRLSRWQQQLGRHDKKRILDWAQRMGLGWYGDGPLPRTAEQTL